MDDLEIRARNLLNRDAATRGLIRLTNIRKILLGAVSATALAGCADMPGGGLQPQYHAMTCVLIAPGRLLCPVGVLPQQIVPAVAPALINPPVAEYAPPQRMWSPPSYGTSRPPAVTPDDDTSQTPPSDAGGSGSSNSSPVPQPAPAPPPDQEANRTPPPAPTPYEAACTGWWRICHFL